MFSYVITAPSFEPTDWRLWVKYLRIWLPQVIALILAIVLIHLLTCTNLDHWHARSWVDFFNFKSNDLGSKSPFSMDAVMYISLLATIILILLGTAEYLWEIREASRSDKYAKGAFFITFFSVLLTCFWAAVIILSNNANLWFLAGRGTPHHGIEIMSLIIFFMFAIIDLFFWVSLKREFKNAKDRLMRVAKSANEDEETFKTRKEHLVLQHKDADSKQMFSLESLLFIDLPVVIGVIIVLLLSDHLINEPGLQTLTDYGRQYFGSDFNVKEEEKVFEAFIHGFSTGAVVMHLAFSQLIFGFLKSRNLYRRNKDGLANYFKVESN